MSLPQVLVIDDQYARDREERRTFLGRCGLSASDPVASAEFCSGQVEEGEAVRNSYRTVAEAVRQFPPGDLALVLLDVRFDSGRVRNGLVTGSPGDEGFGEVVCGRLAKDFGHHAVVTRRVVEGCVALRLPNVAGRKPPAVAARPAGSQEPGKAAMPRAIGVGEVVEALGKTPVSVPDGALKGIFPRLEEAYRWFAAAVIGAALERTRDPVSGRYRQSQAASLVFGDRRTTKDAQRLFNRILGRKGAATVDAEALAVLTEAWRKRRDDSDE